MNTKGEKHPGKTMLNLCNFTLCDLFGNTIVTQRGVPVLDCLADRLKQ
jgi:hypothetical protein